MAYRIGYVASATRTSRLRHCTALARCHQGANGNTKVTDISSKIMTHSGGRVLFGAIGVIVIAVGIYRISKA
jgi:hypothetical protein